jgi:hypothetical protein
MIAHVAMNHVRDRPRVLLFLLMLTGAACSSSRSAPLRVTARTVEDTVVLKQTPTATYFDVTGIVRNDDSREIKVAASCTPEAERDIDGTWTVVFTPACPVDGVLNPLLPGDSLVMRAHVAGYTNAFPQLDPRMTAGRYRLVFGVFAIDSQNPTASIAQRQVSTPFTVK